MDSILHIASRVEPFIDDWLVDRMEGVGLCLHHPVAREVSFEFNQPWEGTSSIFLRVMKDGDRYRNWYRAGQDADQYPAYAESADGIHWERPDLGLVEFDGSRHNNLLLDLPGIANLCVLRDDNPDAATGERYKAIALGPKVDGRATVRGLVSRDGLQWELLDTDPILVAPPDRWPMFDSPNVAFWDEIQQQYVAYLRGWVQGSPEIESDHGDGVRTIRRSVSDDFRTWSEPEFIDMGNAPLEHLYTNACTPYFRAPHIYVMFPRRFILGRKFHDDWEEDGLSDVVFMTSRDGVHWDRRFMEPLITPGLDGDNWNDRSMTVGIGLVPTGTDEMSLYYKEHNRLPSSRMRRGTLRADGFASIHAGYGGGELLTKALIFDGRELVINYSTSAAGSIRVELQDEHGLPLPGFGLADCDHVFGDEIERALRWNGVADLSAVAGRPLKLRFAMDKVADIYSLRFRP